MVKKFETTSTCVLYIVPEPKRKPVPTETVSLAVEEAAIKNTEGICSIRGVSREKEMPFSTVEKVVRKMLHFYIYKIRCATN